MSSIIITQTDDGSSVTAETGGLAELHLAENPTTGYQWSFEDISTGLEVVRDEFHMAGTPLVPGAGGVHEWRLRIAEPGTHALRLRLRREWEDESAAIGRFTVDIVAEEPAE
jgi:inhibitor of cysteine peptidase